MGLHIVEIAGPDASLMLPVRGDGGRERVVQWIAKGLAEVEPTWQITIVAREGSVVPGVAVAEIALSDGRDVGKIRDAIDLRYPRGLVCDVLHVHHPAFLQLRNCIKAKRTLLTHHGFIRHLGNAQADATTWVSNFLREAMLREAPPFPPNLARTAVVHNPIDLEEFLPRHAAHHASDAVGFLGTVHQRVKRVDRAVEIAHALRRTLLVAGPCDRSFLERELLPRFRGEDRYLGELGGSAKLSFLSSIRCLLCPNDPPEAFCLAAAEAMAVGTPVLASPLSGLGEVVEHGVSGFLCEQPSDWLAADESLATLDCTLVRGSIVRRFDLRSIAARYADFVRGMV